jgi:PPOX class probable F420-dependent enzyme
MADADMRMTQAELQEFLLGRHLAILTTNTPGGYPHSTPVWYLTEPDGAISVIVLADAVKIRNIQRDPRIAITIAPETRPYAYARYRGDAELLSEGVDDYPRVMAHRYLGEQAGDEYLASMEPHPPFFVIRLRDERVDTWKDPSV